MYQMGAVRNHRSSCAHRTVKSWGLPSCLPPSTAAVLMMRLGQYSYTIWARGQHTSRRFFANMDCDLYVRFLHVQKWRCIWWTGSRAEHEVSAPPLFTRQCKCASAILRSVLVCVYHPHHEERGVRGRSMERRISVKNGGAKVRVQRKGHHFPGLTILAIHPPCKSRTWRIFGSIFRSCVCRNHSPWCSVAAVLRAAAHTLGPRTDEQAAIVTPFKRTPSKYVELPVRPLSKMVDCCALL